MNEARLIIKKLILLCLIGSLTIISVSCQGKPSEKPPIHFNQNMDSQPKYKPQAESYFFVDKSTMRPPVEGTVPIDYLREDGAFYRGRTESGEFVDTIPMTVDMALLQKGQQEFGIYCTPCHGAVGDGNGIVIKKGFILPPNFHDQKVRDFADGYIFDVISNGVRSTRPARSNSATSASITGCTVS